MAATDPTTVWRIRPELVLALQARFGAPVDSYVNGSQVWLGPVGPKDIMLELRLHPAAGYELPAGVSHHELWDQVVAALVTGADAESMHLGDEHRALSSLWDGLECYPAYGDPCEPAALAAAATEALGGLEPDAVGLVDHGAVGDAWEASDCQVSLLGLVLEQIAL
jgi:hypothetical protein